MTIDIFKNIFLFFLMILLQVLVLNNIQFSGYINPFLYVLFILMLPFEAPKWLVLFASFLIGLGVDMFSDSIGIHAAASTFMGFCRPYVLNIIKPRDGYEFNTQPTIRDMDVRWYITYSGILVFLHHFVFFYIEIFRINEFFSILTRVVLSSFFTILLIILAQLLFTSSRKTS